MFGYVRPYKPEMKVRDFESFRAMYCGLCHTPKLRYGVGSRMLLSYDMCFLAILMAGVTGCGIKTCQKRCAAALFQKRACVREDLALDFAADCSVILTYWKLCDSVQDEHGMRVLGAKWGAWFLRRKYRKASDRLPDFAKAVEQGIHRLDALERENVPSLDRAADAFASIMREAAAGLLEEKIRRPVEQILYHIGRWVYITDAWDDLEDDLKSGSYNAIVARFAVTTADGLAEAKEAVRLTLLQSAQTAAAASELLDLGRSDPVIKNILYMGLPAMAESVMEGTTKQRSSRHGSI